MVPANVRMRVMKSLLQTVSELASASGRGSSCRRTRYDVHPFLLYGSLLGWFRDRKFICYDFDVDVGVMLSEYFVLCGRLEEALRDDPSFVFTRHDKPWLGIFWSNIIHKETKINCDISAFERTRPGKIRRCVSEMYSLFYLGECHSRMPVDWFLPLQRTEMEGVSIYVPHKPKGPRSDAARSRSIGVCSQILPCFYGERWETPDHICEDPENCEGCKRT